MKNHWYVITTTEVSEKSNRQYIGISALDEAEMIQAMGKGTPIVLEGLIYVSIGGETKNYSDDWEPHPNRVFLNPSHIVSVLPLKEDWLEYNKSWDSSLIKRFEDFFNTLKG
jgi:hypothetical protein